MTACVNEAKAIRTTMRWDYAFHGLVTIDGYVGNEAYVELVRNGVVLGNVRNGWKAFIETDQKPEPGTKVTALQPLGGLAYSPVLKEMRFGGGALNASKVVASASSGDGQTGHDKTAFVNSGANLPEVASLCDESHIAYQSLVRQACPFNLVIPLNGDRLIVKERLETAPAKLEESVLERIQNVFSSAAAVCCSSAKDAPTAAAVMAASNEATKYLQLTGSLPLPMELLMLATPHSESIANFTEWKRFCNMLGLPIPTIDEESPEAPDAAAEMLRRLHAINGNGDVAVCTLGRKGSVAADWSKEKVYHTAFEMIDGTSGVPTRSGNGDEFYGYWVFFRQTWSKQSHLRDPIAATAMRSTHAVARLLGLRPGQYDVRSFEL